jgi:uncharacterized membrane protein
MVTDGSSTTLYHRWVGWHAPALMRAGVVAAVGLIVALALIAFVSWEFAVVGGWDAAAVTFLAATWAIIIRSDGHDTERFAKREDETRANATLLVVLASLASLMGVGVVLGRAGEASGSDRVFLIAVAVVTVILSWCVVNTVYTLRYAHLHFNAAKDGIDFPNVAEEGPPSHRDFAYVAFTIGMTYQVSDTSLRSPLLRRTVLTHALVSYVFGVVIVAGAINLIAGLVR